MTSQFPGVTVVATTGWLQTPENGRAARWYLIDPVLGGEEVFRARVGVNATLAALFLILLMGRVVSAHTDEPNALPAPIATATCQNNTLAVTWNPVAGATEYVYAVGITPTDPGADYAIPWTSSGTAIQANIPGYALVPDTTYFCYVKARDASDN